MPEVAYWLNPPACRFECLFVFLPVMASADALSDTILASKEPPMCAEAARFSMSECVSEDSHLLGRDEADVFRTTHLPERASSVKMSLLPRFFMSDGF